MSGRVPTSLRILDDLDEKALLRAGGVTRPRHRGPDRHPRYSGGESLGVHNSGASTMLAPITSLELRCGNP
jgi:hypothetical protein